MKGLLGKRPSPAMVVALLALFVAMGGTGYAAVTITGKNVKNGSLTGKDVKNNTLGSADVKNGNLLAKDFKAGQLPAGTQGPQGPQGPAGPANGPAGGDLAGNYPNPSITGDAVNSGKVADNSLTGEDINESTLGTVPNADEVDGLDARAIRFRANAGTTGQTVLSLGNLTLTASCSAIIGDLSVTATTSRDGSNIDVTGGPADDDFNTGENFDVLAGGDDDVVGTLTHSTGGTFITGFSTTTVTFMADQDSTPDCVFAGTAMSAQSGGIVLDPGPIGP